MTRQAASPRWSYQLATPAPDLNQALRLEQDGVPLSGRWERWGPVQYSVEYPDGPNVRNQRHLAT